MRIAYLGPEGTYSQEAAQIMFPDALLVPYEDLGSVVEAAGRQTTDYAVMPIINSRGGVVDEAHELLMGSGMDIAKVSAMAIKHCLLGASKDENEHDRIYAHPQSIIQCEGWLARNVPHLEIIECSSNAAAAKEVSRDPRSLAIASERAANIYGLCVIEEGIQDDTDNTTTFIALSKS